MGPTDLGPDDLDPDPPTFHVDFRPAQSPWTCLVIFGLCLALVHPTRPDPDPDLRIDLCACPWTCFRTTHLPSQEDPRTQGCTEFPIRQSSHPPACPSPSRKERKAHRVQFTDAKSRITPPCVRVKECNNFFLKDKFVWML